MKTRTIVWITTQFEGFHRWKDAPPDVAFLKHYHRHIFYAKVGVEVKHDDRAVEFFQLKRRIDLFLQSNYLGQYRYFEESCEMIAKKIFAEFDAVFVEVNEDGENGARVEGSL